MVSFLYSVYGAVPGVNCGKALMNIVGARHAVDVGTPRLPQLTPTDQQMDGVRQAAKLWCTQSKQAAPWCADL